jgi:hypothetical protein
MSTESPGPLVRVDSPAALLAVVPRLLGFTPRLSLVVLGCDPKTARVTVGLRYDLPDPPDIRMTADLAAHALGVLDHHHLREAVVIGYGPGRLVTPLVDVFRDVAARTGLTLREVLRVEEGRYWSYLCHNPTCCPAEGVVFDPATQPAAVALTAAGLPCCPTGKPWPPPSPRSPGARPMRWPKQPAEPNGPRPRS